MSAKLFIKGIQEPFILSSEEGKIAQTLIMSGKSKDTPFSIEGVWSGTRGDMRFVAFDKAETAPGGKEIPKMGKDEAEEMKAAMEGLRGKGKANVKDYWLESKGVLRIESVGNGFEYFVNGDKMGEYISCMEKIDSYDDYFARLKYAKRMELKDLEKIAEEVKEGKHE